MQEVIGSLQIFYISDKKCFAKTREAFFISRNTQVILMAAISEAKINYLLDNKQYCEYPESN